MSWITRDSCLWFVSLNILFCGGFFTEKSYWILFECVAVLDLLMKTIVLVLEVVCPTFPFSWEVVVVLGMFLACATNLILQHLTDSLFPVPYICGFACGWNDW